MGIILLLVIGAATQVHSDIPVAELKAKYGQAPSQFMDLDGMQVRYRDEGTGYPVVLIHGTSSSLETWDGWEDVLAKKYRVIRMDLPGFGLTGPDPQNDYSVKYYVNFVQYFLDRLGIKECAMAGNSLGGQITWQYAASHPVQVRKIILVDAGGFPQDKKPMVFNLARTPVVNKLLTYVTPRAIFKKSLEEVYGDPSKISDSLVTRYFEMGLRAGNREAFVQRINQATVADTKQLHMISVPTLIMWGEDDRWIPVANGEKFHQAIEGSDLIVYPHLGHVCMEEDPASTSRDAMNFLAAGTPDEVTE